MKTNFTKQVLMLIAFLPVLTLTAQPGNNTTYNDYEDDLSEYLDLEAVASAFSYAENYQDFERRLNDPENAISNLDLNNDGYVDFLKIRKLMENGYHIILIQAVLGDNYYQDVATMIIDPDRNYRHAVQIIGEPSLYGRDYTIEPEFRWEPPILRWMRYTSINRYYSPYYWNYYPRYFTFRHILPLHHYFTHLRTYVDYHHIYHHSGRMGFGISVNLFEKHGRNDYWRDHRDKDFYQRNQDRDFRNKNDFRSNDNNRSDNRNYQPGANRNTGNYNPNNESDRRRGFDNNSNNDNRYNNSGNTHSGNNNNSIINRERNENQRNTDVRTVQPRTDAGNRGFRPDAVEKRTVGNTESSVQTRTTPKVEPRTEPRVERKTETRSEPRIEKRQEPVRRESSSEVRKADRNESSKSPVKTERK